MTLATHMPVAAAARLMGEHDTHGCGASSFTMWKRLSRAWSSASCAASASTRPRHDADTTTSVRSFVIDQRRVAFVTDGRDAKTIERLADHVDAHNADAAHIQQVCIDMSAPFIKGENLTEAEITFDKFHVMKMLGDAVDRTRRAEAKTRPELQSLSLAQEREQFLEQRQGSTRLIVEAAPEDCACLSASPCFPGGRLAFQEVYAQPSRGWAEVTMDRWHSWAICSRIEPIKAVAKTIRRHRHAILACFDSRIANGLIEGINSLIQAAKARGYRNRETLKAMTYLIAAKLDLKLPT